MKGGAQTWLLFQPMMQHQQLFRKRLPIVINSDVAPASTMESATTESLFATESPLVEDEALGRG